MTIKIVKTDLDKNNFYKQDGLDTDEPIEIEENLGTVRFKKSVKTKAYLSIEAGSGIEAGWGIEAGEGIEAGLGIEAGEGIEAGSGIKAGEGIEAGLGIVILRSGLRAKFVSCLRIAVGFNIKIQATIQAQVKTGDVILGKVEKPNPLPPTEYYWHVHHEQLVEALIEPVENRIAFIKTNKPKNEIEVRLKLLKKVKDVKTLKHAMIANEHKIIEALHKKECPDCPWNGHTIFP